MEHNFAGFGKPISEISDGQLIDFYIALLNGDLNEDPLFTEEDYKIFREEVPKRSKEFQGKIAKIDRIL